MRYRNILLAVLLCCFTLNIDNIARATVIINVSNNKIAPVNLAVPSFSTSSQSYEDIRALVLDDLKSTGYFNIINTDMLQFGADSNNLSDNDLRMLRGLDAQLVLLAEVSPSLGNFIITVRLWDVYAGKELYARKFRTAMRDRAVVGHIIADELYQFTTARSGYFDSRIIFVAESLGAAGAVKRLAIADQNGSNFKYLTAGKNLIFNPRFFPDNEQVIFLQRDGSGSNILVYNLRTGGHYSLGKFNGLFVTPQVSPDGKNLLLSLLSDEGTSSIYTMDLATRALTKITSGHFLDTQPSYSPNGRQIVFSSNRNGLAQLYTMNVNGSNLKLLSGDGVSSYTMPSWSPYGDYISFIQQRQGVVSLGIIKKDGTGKKILVTGFKLADPTWAPGGQAIIFTKGAANGVSNLYKVDINGSNLHQLPLRVNAVQADWSGLLHDL